MVDALNDKNGAAVDWWFIYKLPRGLKAPAKPARATSGLEYLYYQPDDPVGFKMSRRRLDDPGSALQRTVTSALTAAERSDSELGWILYNRGPSQPGRPNGHGRIRSAQSLSKGMLLFDRVANRGLWLVHTAPGYLWGPKSDFPDEERDRGHTFLCITLKNYATANRIARQLLTAQNPQIGSVRLPASVPVKDEIYALATGGADHAGRTSNAVSFRTRQGRKFYSIARHRGWRGDFWSDLVMPKLKVDMEIVPWRMAAKNTSTQPGLNLALLGEDYVWGYDRDPVNWAISTLPSWVCIGDMDRGRGTAQHSGGTVCLGEPRLWLALRSMEWFA